jgi:anthranilate synthase component 1
MNRAVLSTFGDQEELERLYRKLKEGKPMSEAGFEAGPFQPDISDEAFEQMVEKAKEHLRRGDAFQIVLSRTFRAEAKGEPLEFYRSLRKTSPAPYLFFFDLDRFAIGGASPEKIVSVQGGIIESMPIAGTCQKGGCPSELLSSVKETAEHMMLVDLARNDVGRVASPGTVRVAELKAVHEFSHVDHIVSRIVGKLDPRFDALDALDASFPAGTLTGAPKKRAMEIIDAIEPSKRGLYGGAIIAFEANGNLTSCIAIRTAIIEKGTISVQAGAGIVIDSDPKKEALETVLKAQSAMEAGHATYHR